MEEPKPNGIGGNKPMAENKPETDLGDLRNDMAVLREDLVKITQKIADLGRAEAEGVKENVAGRVRKELDKAEEAKDRLVEDLRKEVNEVKEQGKKAVGTVEQQIREQPLISLLIAFVVGLLLGKILDKT